ncbi:hypothetical protein [Nonomuraea aridisoli]|uniref:Uncharacterized protein n=1 Tax=Nonomuraea aridisoli TaxID=2070368 RepID=A0A2W2DVH5_9ACTN|nr:hypothetical protein [Nonomuraea aridisoli]PZG15886.1 hypothetical protein C1J01_22730 [Nonomuraea aridisoli]
MTHGSSNTQPTPELELAVVWESVQWTCLVCGGAEEIAPDEEAPTPPICPTCHRLAVAEALATLLGVRR